MGIADLIRLVSLAAIWGSSFIFMKILAPVLGPIMTACLRVTIAGSTLIAYFYLTKLEVDWKANWKHYLVIAILNGSIPFTLFAYAALHIPAGLSAILNATAPHFGALLAAIFLADKLTTLKMLGLFLGLVGVSLIALKGGLAMDQFGYLGILACLFAAFCYGLVGVYLKKYCANLKPMAIAGSSQFLAGMVLLPLALTTTTINGVIDLKIIITILCFSLLCSGLAFVIYYRLVANIGPSKALTVTFLTPVFGLLWGVLFLGEVLTFKVLIGCVIIIIGTTLVLYKKKDKV
ncbi:MAG: DMT family transporter [Bacteriovoracaceae bacterium]|nr:DMT family transporter [Bacteriovoracaceae bacterium]